jgi:F-type H+-transporting ATPase subunit b
MSPIIVLAEGGLIDPQPGLAIWTIITFVIVAAFLRWKVWGPLSHVIEGREKSIQQAIDQAKTEREQAEKLLAEQQLAIADARKEAAEMVRKNRLEVEKAKEELMAKARSEADNLLAVARKTIEDEKLKALAEIRDVAVELAIGAAGKLVASRMDDASQRTLAEDFIAGVQKQPGAPRVAIG